MTMFDPFSAARCIVAGCVSVSLAVTGCSNLPETLAGDPLKPSCDFGPVRQASRQPVEGAALRSPYPDAMTDVPLNTVNFTDKGMIKKVMLQSVWSDATPAGPVQVQARFVNCTDHPLQIEGRTHFFDAAMRPVEPPTAWARLVLPERSIATYSESSTVRSGVADFLIEVREGR